jgi:hypothetical protein
MRVVYSVVALMFSFAFANSAFSQYSCKKAPCVVVGKNGWVVGEVKTFSFGEPPNAEVMAELASLGWIECAGQTLSRTQFPQLWNTIGDSWGSSDGKTDYFLPDTRGQFLRGWNHAALSNNAPPAFGGDPNAGSRQSPRTVAGTGTPGNSGDSVGSIEQGQVGDHQHVIPGFGYAQIHNTEFGNGIGGLHNFNGANSTTGGVNGPSSETRPHNTYVLYAIFTGVPSTLDNQGRPTPTALVVEAKPYLGEKGEEKK